MRHFICFSDWRHVGKFYDILVQHKGDLRGIVFLRHHYMVVYRGADTIETFIHSFVDDIGDLNCEGILHAEENEDFTDWTEDTYNQLRELQTSKTCEYETFEDLSDVKMLDLLNKQIERGLIVNGIRLIRLTAEKVDVEDDYEYTLFE